MSSCRRTIVESGFSRIGTAIIVAVIAIVSVAAVFVWRSRNALPAPGSETYERVTRAFYRGLASLEVGLLDDAKREFTTVTAQVVEEPAAWANLGLTHLRLGELEAAAVPVERALMLAPDNADLALLAGRMEIARGRLDDGVSQLRRAVELAPDALQPRFALAEEVERSGVADGDAQALTLLDELVQLAPQNMAVLVERARVAAKAGDLQRLNDSIARLKPMASSWPELAVQMYQELQTAVGANDLAMAQRSTAFLRNVLARVPAFGEDLASVRTPTELIAEPVQQFIALTPPSAVPAAPDANLRFEVQELEAAVQVAETLFVAPDPAGAAPAIYTRAIEGLVPVGGGQTVGQFPMNPDGPGATPDSVLSVDFDNDFITDVVLAGSAGVSVFLQTSPGTFSAGPAEKSPCFEVWGADIEMDGDLDLVCRAADAVVLRNNGDRTLTRIRPFAGLIGVRTFAWSDVDGDADPDAVFVDQGRLKVFLNRQAGDFVPDSRSMPSGLAAMTIADLNSDGTFDIITVDQAGSLQRTWLGNERWNTEALGGWQQSDGFDPATVRLLTADLDNNGAVDVIATARTAGGSRASRLWLANEQHTLEELSGLPAAEVFGIADLNNDGRQDLIAVVDSRPVRLINRGTADYHWKKVNLRAQAAAGDQRINSFGLGGYLEARAGLQFQKQRLTGGQVHIGLGTHTAIDVVRIVWPNGVPQAEFGTSVDDVMMAEQRLKGSCPWVFSWDGTRMVFVTDFLWRSPLGLRINAQDTAGVTQTEDWVKLRGDQLVPRDGIYDVRITAELWETHFFDHVSLLAVDRPADTEVFVDERFSPVSPPALAVQAVRNLQPVTRAWDHRGADVTSAVSVRDGKYLSTFARGRYQGIAEDHFVEIDPGAIGPDTLLVANGWIYPTDSSINVAIAQAGIAPRGLSLEAQGRDGSWRVVNADIGFPAGKNKTILIDLRQAQGAGRLRLRTNLEIYWDSLHFGSRSTLPVKTTRIQAAKADLRYRGFSYTVSPRGDSPETPEYDRIVSTSPRWRDLTGYHTRFGDVRELIGQVDDRYVIMNAGDEMRLQFAKAPAPPSGWKRDFVLIGDGWEKDGDYNTGFSQGVLPLPSHDTPNYGAGTASLALEDDPVYQRHRDDWQRYHTRYVTPRRFLNGLKPVRVN
jgi:tetratricopeptide (TPR) repeat protein